MTHQGINSVFAVGFYAACIIWTVLLVMMVRQLVKKDHQAFKITLLYSVNSLVLLLAWGIILELALIVLGPKDAVVLRQQADGYFVDLMRFSGMVLLGLAVVNTLYLKFVAQVPPLRIAVILLAVDAAILFTASYLSSEHYYLGLLRDTH